MASLFLHEEGLRLWEVMTADIAGVVAVVLVTLSLLVILVGP